MCVLGLTLLRTSTAPLGKRSPQHRNSSDVINQNEIETWCRSRAGRDKARAALSHESKPKGMGKNPHSLNESLFIQELSGSKLNTAPAGSDIMNTLNNRVQFKALKFH